MQKIGLNWDSNQENGIIFNKDNPDGTLFKGADKKPELGFEYDSFIYNPFRNTYHLIINGQFVEMKEDVKKKILKVVKSYGKMEEEQPPALPAAPKVNVKTYGNIWAKEIELRKKGDKKEGHKHEFDHLHFIHRGRVLLSIYNREDRSKLLLQKEYKAGDWVKVPKEHFHDMEALEPNTIGYCIQAVRTANNEVIGTDYNYDDDFLKEVKAYEDSLK